LTAQENACIIIMLSISIIITNKKIYDETHSYDLPHC
jgi:hypothetical protein